MSEKPQATNPFDMSNLMAGLDPAEMMNKFSKAVSDFQIPGVDLNALMETQRKNVEALTSANKQAIEGVQAVVSRQTEILQQTMEEAANAIKQLSSASTPTEAAAKQGELMKQAFEKAIANMRELAEMSAKANTEAFDTVKQRVNENIAEIRNLVKNMRK